MVMEPLKDDSKPGFPISIIRYGIRAIFEICSSGVFRILIRKFVHNQVLQPLIDRIADIDVIVESPKILLYVISNHFFAGRLFVPFVAFKFFGVDPPSAS